MATKINTEGLPEINSQSYAGKIWEKFAKSREGGVRFEVYARSLNINKFEFLFQKLDDRGETGRIVLYMDAPMIISAINDLIANLSPIEAQRQAHLETVQQATFWSSPHMGTSAQDLAKRGRARANGFGEYRHLDFISSARYTCYASAYSCDGHTVGQGLIQPVRGQDGHLQNCTKAGIPLSLDDLKSLVTDMTQSYVGFNAAQWTILALTPIVEQIANGAVERLASALGVNLGPAPSPIIQPVPQRRGQQQGSQNYPVNGTQQPQYRQGYQSPQQQPQYRPQYQSVQQQVQPQYQSRQQAQPQVFNNDTGEVMVGQFLIDEDDLPF